MPRPPRRVAPQAPLYSAPATDGTDKAPLDSPVFTGIPTAPEPSPTDISQQIATTQFVALALTSFVSGLVFSDISGTLADAQLVSSNVTQFQADLAIAWSQLTGTPTTLAGYGITDAVSLLPSADGTRVKLGGGTTAVTSSTPAFWVEVGGSDPDVTRLFQVGNSNRPVANNEWNAFAIELSASTNNNLLQLVGYGTDGNRKVLLTFKKALGTNADTVQFNAIPQLVNGVAMDGVNSGGGSTHLILFNGSNRLCVGPYSASSGLGLDLLLNTSSDALRIGIQNSAQSLVTEYARFTNGRLGMNGVTAPSQIIDIGSGKIVADGSLLTNLPPNALVSAPATSTSAGVAGQWAKDATNVYICVATNTWYKFAATATTF